MTPLSSRSCSGWCEISEALDSFPHQKLGVIEEPDGGYGGLGQSLWVFRGHKSTEYRLEPSIERAVATKPLPWPAIEVKILEEFQSRAQMHLSPSDVPKAEDRLGWLGLMQHYGIPTRLLDFTLSPYVALYFALSNRTDEENKSPAEVWAIDAQALVNVAEKTSGDADREEAEYARRNASTIVSVKTQGASLDPRFAATEADSLQYETASRSRMNSGALLATGIRRAHFIENGFVTFAMPPIQNRRLSSQQGAFLFSGAEDRTFHDSLFRMMNGKANWYRRFQITNDGMLNVERELFKRNIHHLSLFPDMEGLAGFIRQKTRLHWVPDDSPSIDQP
jgi:FRG domain